MIDEKHKEVTDKEFFENDISQKSFKKLAVIKEPDLFELRDYFVNLHFIDKKSLNADSTTKISAEAQPFVVDFIIKAFKYACENNKTIKTTQYNRSISIEVYMTEKSGYVVWLSKNPDDEAPMQTYQSSDIIMTTFFSDDRYMFLENIYDRPTLDLTTSFENAQSILADVDSKLDDETKCWLILKGIKLV